MLGDKLNPILVEIESVIWEFEHEIGGKPNFSMEAFRAATKIFMSVMMDKVWEVQEFDKMDMIDRENMAEKCGNELRKFVKLIQELILLNYTNAMKKPKLYFSFYRTGEFRLFPSFKKSPLLWKDKFNTPRCECEPYFYIKWLWHGIRVVKGDDQYWEQWLWVYKYYDEDYEKAKAEWEWVNSETLKSTWIDY